MFYNTENISRLKAKRLENVLQSTTSLPTLATMAVVKKQILVKYFKATENVT